MDDQSNNAFLPAKPIEELLRENGITEYDDRVLYQLLEFQHRLTKQLLSECGEYAAHAGRNEMNEEDLKLALDARINYNYKSLPTRKFVSQVANSINAKSLPRIKTTDEMHLPEAKLCFVSDDYDLIHQNNKSNTIAPSTNTSEQPKEQAAENTNKYNVQQPSEKKKLKLNFKIQK